ncbi:putative ubiquitin-conjugating enzyme [Erysiphe necator]|uniref:Putative ubiquitin-conjugating enzyme n=1 Tax=Uncinula necator TaxID=52586 RepID=A0A0B1P044_UNCNE|nr:putative ubiquitin-conjugating enzyme [Erysiphe necator]
MMASLKYARSPTIKRILHEAAELAQSPSPDFHAAPVNDADLFDWHFTIRGPPSSVFESGIYHGRILLPPTYPLRPPSFRFLNSSGRFEVNREICLSISGHHEETWMPAWGVRTALVALRSFMETDPKGQLGGLECTATEREKFARESVSWVCSVCQKKNEDILKDSLIFYKDMGTDLNSIMSTPENHVTTVRTSVETERNVVENGIVSDTKAQETDDKHFNESLTKNTSKLPSYTLSGSSQTKLAALSSPNKGLSSDSNTQIIQPSQTIPVISMNQGSPLWIDRAIATIIICLVLMVMKVLLGLGRNFP